MKYKDNFYHITICSLVIAVIVLFSKVGSLKSDIKLLQNSLSNESNSLGTQISSIYDNVDRQLKKQASLFSSTTQKLGELDPDTKMVNVKFAVLPKTIVDNMKVNLTVGDNTVTMTKSANGEYSANILVDLFADYDTFPLITIVANGETKTEYLETLGVSNIWTDYLPTMVSGNIRPATASLNNGKLTVDGQLELEYRLAELNKSVKFEEYDISAEIDGEEISRKDITSTIKDDFIYNAYGADLSVPFREIYNLSGNGSLTIYVIAEDSLGFIHKKAAFSWMPPDEENRQPEPATQVAYEGEVIYDKDGNVLYGKMF